MNSDINPFKFGSDLAKGEYFADRIEDRRKLKSDLKNGKRVLVYSARRYGKTALIINVLQELEKEDYITAYFDVSTAPDKSLFISKYKSLFLKAGTKEWFFDWLKENIPKVKVSVGDVELDLTDLSNKDVDEAFGKILDLPQELATKKKKRVIVALDEFHEIRSLNSGSAENMMRSKFQFQDSVSYVFSGSQAHLLEDMFESKDKPFYKSASLFELKKIPKDQYKRFIEQMFSKSDIKTSEEMIDLILSRTDSNTYFTQQLSHELWDVCKLKGHTSVTEEDIDLSINQVISNQSAVYERIWESLAPNYRKLLLGMIDQDETKIWSKEFRMKNRMTVGAIDKAIQHLSEQYLIEKGERKRYVIPDPFFTKWIARKISGDLA